MKQKTRYTRITEAQLSKITLNYPPPLPFHKNKEMFHVTIINGFLVKF